jgi:hypothetical protein
MLAMEGDGLLPAFLAYLVPEGIALLFGAAFAAFPRASVPLAGLTAAIGCFAVGDAFSGWTAKAELAFAVGPDGRGGIIARAFMPDGYSNAVQRGPAPSAVSVTVWVPDEAWAPIAPALAQAAIEKSASDRAGTTRFLPPAASAWIRDLIGSEGERSIESGIGGDFSLSLERDGSFARKD